MSADVSKKPANGAGRERFLDAAAKIFATNGYEGSTIRLIVKEAGTSLARLNLHWSGKEQLFAEVLAGYFDEIHAEQNALLDAVPTTGSAKQRVHAILIAFYMPGFKRAIGDSPDEIGHLVYSRAIVDPAPEIRRIVVTYARPMVNRVTLALREALPDVDATRFTLLLNVVFASYIHPQLNGMRLEFGVDTPQRVLHADAVAHTLANIICEGLDGLEA